LDNSATHTVDIAKIVAHAKSLPTYDDARPIVECLYAICRGMYNPEIHDMIESIKVHFQNEIENKWKSEIQKIVDRRINNLIGGSELNVDDEQITKAINHIESIMDSHRDWGAIYRILVDYCGWPSKYKDFEKRINLLHLNLNDNVSFTYQGLQMGISPNWPKTFKEWLIIRNDDDTVFEHRKKIATAFQNYLKCLSDKN